MPQRRLGIVRQEQRPHARIERLHEDAAREFLRIEQ
jgi:hypothetical protein